MIFLWCAFWCEPVCTFPAEFLAKDSTHIFQAVITWRCAQWATCFTFFIWIVNCEDVCIGFFVLFFEEAFCCVRAETTWVNAIHVNGWLAFNNPFSQLPASTACGCDTKAVTFIEPEVRQIPCRTDDRAAIRCVGNRAIINFLHAHLSKGRNAGNR